MDGGRDQSLLPAGGLLDVPLVGAAQNVVPVARTAAEAVDEAAAMGYRPVPRRPISRGSTRPTRKRRHAKPRRKVRRDPSNN